MWLWDAVGQTPGVQKEGLMFLLLTKEAVCSFPSSPSPFPNHHAHHPLGRMSRRVSQEFWLVSQRPPFLSTPLFAGAQGSDSSPGNPALPTPSSCVAGVIASRRCRTKTGRDLETPVRLAEARARRSLGHSQGFRDIVGPFGTGPGGKKAPGRRGVILRALDTVLPSGRCENRGNSAGRACSPSKDLGAKASARPVHYPEGIEGPSRERSSGDRGPHRRSHPVLRSPGRLQLPPTWSAGLALGPDLPGRPRPRDPTEASPPQDALAMARVASKETPVPRPEQSRPWAGQGLRAGAPTPGPATSCHAAPAPRRGLDRGGTRRHQVAPTPPCRPRPASAPHQCPLQAVPSERRPGHAGHVGEWRRGTRGRGGAPSFRGREGNAHCGVQSSVLQEMKGPGLGGLGTSEAPRSRPAPNADPAPPPTALSRAGVPGRRNAESCLPGAPTALQALDHLAGNGGGGKGVGEGDPGGRVKKGDAPLWVWGEGVAKECLPEGRAGLPGRRLSPTPADAAPVGLLRGAQEELEAGSQLPARPRCSLAVPERVRMGRRLPWASWPLGLKQRLHHGRR